MKKAYEDLIRYLLNAYRRLEDDPAEAHWAAVLAARDFLVEVDAHPAAVAVMNSTLAVVSDAVTMADHGNKPGPKPLPWREVHRLGILAAAVTGLCDRGWSVADAVKGVRRHVKIGKKELRTLRDNIHRGRANPLVGDAYYHFVGELNSDGNEDFTPEGVLNQMRIWLAHYGC